MLSLVLGRLPEQCSFVSVIITASKYSKEVQIKRRKIRFVERFHFVNHENRQEAVRVFGDLCVEDDTE